MAIEPVIDPLVIDKAVDRFRKGKRNLESQCAHYGVRIEGAHDAGVDAVAALEVAKALAERYPEVGESSPLELHRRQVEWKEAADRDFAEYRARRGEPYEPESGWPVRVRLVPRQPESPETTSGPAELPEAPGGLF